MASIRFGNGVADVRGSINGTTFSRNANGGYARNRTTPTNPRTGKQVAQRNLLTGLTSAWRELNDAARKTWIDGAPNFPYKNRLGETSTYTGAQLYTKLNMALLSAGLSRITTCPTPEVLPTLGAGVLQIQLDGSTLVATVTFDSTISSSYTAQVFASVGVSAGRTASSTPKRLVQTITGSGSAVVNFKAGYEATYGLPSLGANIVVEVKVTNNTTGQQFTAFVGSQVVQEA